MAWLYLLGACICEILWSGVGMKLAQGGNNNKAAIATFVVVNITTVFFMLATKTLPVTIAYPVLMGLGIAGSTTIAILVFHESANLLKVFLILLIFVGVIGLKLIDKHA